MDFSNTTSQLYIYSFNISAYPVAGVVLRPSCTPLGRPMALPHVNEGLGDMSAPKLSLLPVSLRQGCPQIQKTRHCLAFSKSRDWGVISLLETFLQYFELGSGLRYNSGIIRFSHIIQSSVCL